MIFSITEARRFNDGYGDRARKLPPENTTDSAYFRGYCDRLLEELQAETPHTLTAA